MFWVALVVIIINFVDVFLCRICSTQTYTHTTNMLTHSVRTQLSISSRPALETAWHAARTEPGSCCMSQTRRAIVHNSMSCTCTRMRTRRHRQYTFAHTHTRTHMIWKSMLLPARVRAGALIGEQQVACCNGLPHACDVSLFAVAPVNDASP